MNEEQILSTEATEVETDAEAVTPEECIAEAEVEVTEEVDKAETPDGEDSERERVKAELLAEIDDLKQKLAELEATRAAQERMLAQVEEFNSLFPDVPLQALPESVWDAVRAGAPLAASYALYERQAAAREERISRINRETAQRSSGLAGKNSASEYFTPDEVRRMTPIEVHANYSRIRESMKKWI